MEHLQRFWEENPQSSPDFLKILLTQLPDMAHVVSLITQKINSQKANKFFTSKSTADNWWFSLLEFLKFNRTTAKEPPTAPKTLEQLAELIPPEKWGRPLCVMVDEIQNVKPKHEQFINELHEGNHGLPIVPLYAGLANSREALARIGVSRLEINNVRTLFSLSVAESKRYVELLIDRCRIAHTQERLDDISNGIAERSEG